MSNSNDFHDVYAMEFMTPNEDEVFSEPPSDDEDNYLDALNDWSPSNDANESYSAPPNVGEDDTNWSQEVYELDERLHQMVSMTYKHSKN